MKTEKNRSSDPPPPIPLEYCGTDLPGDFRREADAVAGDFGGWSQIATAVGFGAAGVLLGWLPFGHGLGCFSIFFGVIGFCIGLFYSFPQGRAEWQRVFAGILGGVIGGIIGWLLYPDAAGLLVLAGYYAVILLEHQRRGQPLG